jgi:hypothetical protein
MLKKALKIFILIYLFFLTALSFSWAVYHIYEGQGRIFGSESSEKVILFASIPTKVYHFILDVFDGNVLKVHGLLIKDEQQSNGFKLSSGNLSMVNGQNILISTYNLKLKCNQIKLFDLDSRQLKYEWIVQDSIIHRFNHKSYQKKINLFTNPFILDKKNIVTLDYPYLTRIDSSGNILWRKFLKVHHSLESDHENNFWACGYLNPNNGFKYLNKDNLPPDAIFKINSITGDVSFKKSIFDILRENGFDYLITIGNFIEEKDSFHLNDIQPALYSTDFWNKGDLLISIRNRNTIFLYRPSTNKIIWLKTGPWSNQHDCDFVDSSKILLFGNDIVRSAYDNTLINESNNAYIFDFATNSVTTPYTNFFKSSNISTIMEGGCELLPNGDLFVEETCNGRILVGDSDRVKLTYVDRENHKFIKRFNWSRIIKDHEIKRFNFLK